MDITTALSLTAPLAIRTRCCYCQIKHVTDGRGPILAGELISDGMCALAAAKWNAEMDDIEAAQATR